LHRFLERHRQDVADAVGKNDPLPDLVLFNGGSLKPTIIQERIVENLVRWFGAQGTPRPRILENRNHDTAVAVGAAYYGLVKAGRGVRVGSGSPRSYYLGVGQSDEDSGPEAPRAICLVERGLDEGSTIELGDHQFDVLANQPVRFMLYSSSFRGKDHMGELVAIDDTLMPLPPAANRHSIWQKRSQNTHPGAHRSRVHRNGHPVALVPFPEKRSSLAAAISIEGHRWCGGCPSGNGSGGYPGSRGARCRPIRFCKQ
jgi:hypothetical protein